jgi:hypothetical protein
VNITEQIGVVVTPAFLSEMLPVCILFADSDNPWFSSVWSHEFQGSGQFTIHHITVILLDSVDNGF